MLCFCGFCTFFGISEHIFCFAVKVIFPNFPQKQKYRFLPSRTTKREFSFSLGGRSSKSCSVLLPDCLGRLRADRRAALPTASPHGGDFSTSTRPHGVRHRRDLYRALSLPKRREVDHYPLALRSEIARPFGRVPHCRCNSGGYARHRSAFLRAECPQKARSA